MTAGIGIKRGACALVVSLFGIGLCVGSPAFATHRPGVADRPKVGPGQTNNVLHHGTRGIVATPSTNPQDLLQCLLGPGVTVSNVVMNAANGAAGTFTGALSIIGIDSGMILSSGSVSSIVGPNTLDDVTTDNQFPGDADLDALIPGYQTFDAAILEFDFECANPQVVSFQYVFASDEYNEYVNSQYNDVFGFFLNGVNIAAVPADCSNPGIPVSINNVDCDNPYAPPSGLNCNCYRNNDLTDGGPFFDTEMDGLTQVFYATGTIQAGANHIKLAIADAGDYVLDSNVMIACQSFTCGAPPPTGACCFSNESCVTLSYPDCYNRGGNYYGDHIPCSPNPCLEPVGACCFSESECEVEGQFGCESNGGIYQGDGSPCLPNPCGTTSVDNGPAPAATAEIRLVPNPSTGSVMIQYRVPEASAVAVDILDPSGRLVRQLQGGFRPAGQSSLTWDGRDAGGNSLPTGVYFIRIKTAAGVTTARAMVIR